MGEARSSHRNNEKNHCKTIAIRYHFVLESNDNSTENENTPVKLKFVAHKVRQLEVDVQPVEKEEAVLKPENVEYEDDVQYLRSLDPKEWKLQDHYKVLGIGKLRYKATEEIVKVAYRKKVLKHHPDKRKALGEDIHPDDDYFTCITMAYETLGNQTKRRAYDSVDPEFDNNIPSQFEVKKTNDYYEIFNQYFELNSRWSEKQPVPKFGSSTSTRQQVEKFYNFWYDFKSWREYSYEDEEDKEKCQDRDERRYVDKLNKAERMRKKKEEMARIRTLVDSAYNNDPRIAQFKQAEKDKKLAMKRAKQTAAQAKRDEEERLVREAQAAKEKAEQAERARIEAKRQEREIQKRALKKERKTLRDTCKSYEYFVNTGDDSLKNLTSLEKICETYQLRELEKLNKEMKKANKAGVKEIFFNAVKVLEKSEEEEKRKNNPQKEKLMNGTATTKAASLNNSNNSTKWTENDVQLLVKAVNIFPAGTNQRWEVIANFLCQHGSCDSFKAKQVLAKAKDLQNADFSKSNNLKETAAKQAFEKAKRDKQVIPDENGISKKLDTPLSQPLQNGVPNKSETPQVNGKTAPVAGANSTTQPWTTTEQQLLEQALKTYPASTAERWDRIAECIPNRSKKECMKRYKELVETVKAKKAAQNVAAK